MLKIITRIQTEHISLIIIYFNRVCTFKVFLIYFKSIYFQIFERLFLPLSLLLLNLWPRETSALQHIHDVVACVISIFHHFLVKNVHGKSCFSAASRFLRPFTFAAITTFTTFSIIFSICLRTGLLLTFTRHCYSN